MDSRIVATLSKEVAEKLRADALAEGRSTDEIADEAIRLRRAVRSDPSAANHFHIDNHVTHHAPVFDNSFNNWFRNFIRLTVRRLHLPEFGEVTPAGMVVGMGWMFVMVVYFGCWLFIR